MATRTNAERHRDWRSKPENKERLRAYRKLWMARPENIGYATRASRRRDLPEATRPCPELCEANCGRKATHLDHCHVTNTFRGWLCHWCNSGIGMLGDSAISVERALVYIRGH